MPGNPTYPAIEVILMIFPRRLSRMNGSTALIIATAPKTLTSNCRLISSSGLSSRVPSWPYPALLTRTSIGPISLSACAIAGPMAAKSVTSNRMARARAGSIAPNSCRAASLRTVPITEYPDESASVARARPKPEPAPVIRKFLFPLIAMSFLRRVAIQGLFGPRLCRRRRDAGELDAGAARFSHHKVHLGALARPFRRELNYGVGPCGDTRVQGVKRLAVHDLKCKMV